MTIYIIITLLLILLSPIRRSNNLIGVYSFFVVFLILMAGFRGVGYDYYNYIDIYKWNDGPPMEPCFEFLLWITRFCGNSIALFLPIALISVLLKTSFIYKYSYFPFLSLLIYFHISYLLHDMGQIRYGLAMAFVLYAMSNLACENTKNFFILTTIAVSFHYSALCVYPIYYLRTLMLSSKQFSLCVAVMFFLLSLNVIGLFQWLMGQIPIVGITYRIAVYAVGNNDEVNSNVVGLNSSFVIRFVVLLFLYRLRNTNKALNYNSIFNFYLYGLFLYLALGSIPEFSYRCSLYFRLLDIIVIPCIIYYMRNYLLKITIFLLMLLYCSGDIFNASSESDFWREYAPYKTAL